MKYNTLNKYLKRQARILFKKQKLNNPKIKIDDLIFTCEYDNPFSLAILKNGKNMIGEKLYVMSPLKNKVIPVEVVSSHYVDPKGERVRSWERYQL